MAVVETAARFDADRVAAQADRLLITGRWTGIRGRRFVRPTLTCETADGPRRLLADLEHKPWSANDGEPWKAAFPWEAGAELVGTPELSVAPDIAVRVDQGGAPRAAKRQAAAEIAELRARAQRLERELAAERDRHGQARRRAEEAERAGLEAEAAIARRDAALERLERAETELAGVRAERDAAAHAEQRSDDARASAMARIRQLMSEYEQAERRREQAERRREQAERELTRVREAFSRAGAATVAPAVNGAPERAPGPRFPTRHLPTRRATTRAPSPVADPAPIRAVQRAAALTVLVIALVMLAVILHSL